MFCSFLFLCLWPLSEEQRSELGEKGSEKWSSYQYVGRAGSVIPTASLAGTEVSVEEIRSAAADSDHYPPSIHAALVSSPEPDPTGKHLLFVCLYPNYAFCNLGFAF